MFEPGVGAGPHLLPQSRAGAMPRRMALVIVGAPV